MLFLLTQLLVCRARRMNHKRLFVSDVRQIAHQLLGIHHLAAHRRVAALHAKAEYAAERVPLQRAESQLV